MNGIVTPDQIARELRELTDKADGGANTIRYHELRFDTAMRAYQDAYDDGYAESSGTIAEREIAGRTAARGLKITADAEKADLNWAKAEVRRIESKQTNLQSQLKAITVTYG